MGLMRRMYRHFLDLVLFFSRFERTPKFSFTHSTDVVIHRSLLCRVIVCFSKARFRAVVHTTQLRNN